MAEGIQRTETSQRSGFCDSFRTSLRARRLRSPGLSCATMRYSLRLRVLLFKRNKLTFKAAQKPGARYPEELRFSPKTDIVRGDRFPGRKQSIFCVYYIFMELAFYEIPITAQGNKEIRLIFSCFLFLEMGYTSKYSIYSA